MLLHFTEEEFKDRQERCQAALAAADLDGLLIFRQESMYWLTGYDTFGYVWFQCLFISGEGKLVLLTRSPDLRQAQHTSCISDIRIWVDGPDAQPAGELKKILAELGMAGKRLGVEYQSYGLTGWDAKRLDAALEGFAELTDASQLISRLRVIKSPAEIVYALRAGELGDAAYEAALEETRAGAFEGDILAAMHGAIFRRGGDDPANEFVIGSGPQALLCRYHSGRRYLDARDQLTLEWAGTYRHYHAALMNTFVIGDPPEQQVEMHEVARDALLAVEAELRPGKTAGEAFDAHARVLDAAGFQKHRLNACGYSQGTTFGPNWMDWPMLYHGNPTVLEPGMIFFVHIVIFDSERNLAMTLGRSSLIEEEGLRPLSLMPLDLVCC